LAVVLWCALAYALSLGAALAVGYALRTEHPILIAAVADVVATLVIFAFSVALRNSSMYDPYWSVAPIIIAAYWAIDGMATETLTARQWLACGLVTAWGLRLTDNCLWRWRSMRHEDWRYVDLQKQHGRRYWLVSFAGIHMMPTILVFVACLPLYPALTETGRSLNGFDALALLVAGTAIVLETIADQQLERFLASNTELGRILATGLWAYTRHPNYLGEVMFWWGLYALALAVSPGYWWTGIGALAITLLFLFVSIPLLDNRSLARRPGYAEHMQRVPGLLPRFPRKD